MQKPPPAGWPSSVDPWTTHTHPTAVVATTALAGVWRRIWIIRRLLRQTTTYFTGTSRSECERDGLTDQVAFQEIGGSRGGWCSADGLTVVGGIWSRPGNRLKASSISNLWTQL